MISTNSVLDIGYIFAQIFFYVSILMIVLGVIAAIFCKDELGMNGVGITGLFASIFGGILLVSIVLAFWPFFDSSYHRFYKVTGNIQAINIKEWSSNYVVTVNNNVFRCDDSRCATLRVGDAVNLNCIREWQYQSTAGWACRWGN